jgi:hypothetical protein
MWATKTRATALAIVASKSFASLRHRPSQAKLRSTTQRRGRTLFASHALERGAQFVAGIAAVGEDMPQPRIQGTDRGEREYRPDVRQVRRARSARRRRQGLQQHPFAIRLIACIAQPRPHTLAASGFGLGHRELPQIFANPKESQPTEI